MASLFRPTFTDKKTGKLRKAKKWYGQYKDADGKLCRVPLSANKSAAQAMLAELVKQAELGKAGIRDPFAPHRKTLMTRHRDDWLAVLTARGRDKSYTDLKRARVTAILNGCGFVYAADLSAEKAERFFDALRRGEVAPVTQDGKKPQKAKKLSVQTTNDYLQAISQLCVWMVENSRMERNPFQQIQKGNAERDRRHVRRALNAAELEKLITTSQVSGTDFRGMTGLDRAFLYAVAAATGYRKRELAALVPECFVLDGEQPRVDLDAEHTKNGKAASQPVSPGLAHALREYLVGKPSGEPVWPGTWSERAAEMLKADAQAASIALSIQTKDGPQVLDFHSLRGTFATLLDTIDLSLKARQELMRHSDPRLTMNRYTRANQSEIDQAATRIPVTVPKLAATESACTKLAQTPAGEGGSERVTAPGNAISLATAGNGGEAEKQANRRDLQGITPLELESHLRDLNPGPPLYESLSENPGAYRDVPQWLKNKAFHRASVPGCPGMYRG